MSDDPIYESKQPIKALATTDAHFEVTGNEYNYGFIRPATKIEAYKEPGEMAHVTWFKVWWNDEIVYRVNGKHVIFVEYETESE